MCMHNLQMKLMQSCIHDATGNEENKKNNKNRILPLGVSQYISIGNNSDI